MQEYYHPSSAPQYVNDDWLRANTQWNPEVTPVDTLAENGYYQVKSLAPTDHSAELYDYVWSETVSSPYCIRAVDEIKPRPLAEAKAWMLRTFPAHADDINAATSVDELQQILDFIKAPT